MHWTVNIILCDCMHYNVYYVKITVERLLRSNPWGNGNWPLNRDWLLIHVGVCQKSAQPWLSLQRCQPFTSCLGSNVLRAVISDI